MLGLVSLASAGEESESALWSRRHPMRKSLRQVSVWPTWVVFAAIIPMLSLLVGSGPVAEGGASPTAEDLPLGPLPAVFIGELPCADCPGIRYQLDLFPDGIFYLRTTYLARERGFDEIGRWFLSSDREQLLLQAGREAPQLFSVIDPDTLEKLDALGREIDSQLDYRLRRAAGIAALEPRLSLAGMYRYQADAGLFTECLTRRRMPVATEADNAALERAYFAARERPGQALFAQLEGRIAMRARSEGEGGRPTLVVNRFLGLDAAAACAPAFEPAGLEATRWALGWLPTGPVTERDARAAPFLMFEAESGRVGGFGGCNRFLGSYELDGDQLTFGRLAGTLMACREGMDTERALHAALERTRRWRITGHHLSLLDEFDDLLARLEARSAH